MAEESEDGQEKTEEPASRVKAAREGQVLSSKEMYVYWNYYVVWTCIFDPLFSQMLLSYWAMFFDWSNVVNDKKSILDILYYACDLLFINFYRYLFQYFVVILTQIAVGGINFAPKALQFKGKR